MKNNYMKNTSNLLFGAFAVLVFGLLTSSVYGQWSATNASTANNNSFTGMIEHNGNLYSSSYEGLKKWDTGTETWANVPFTGFTLGGQEYIQQLASTGTHIYVTKWNPFCQSNIVYKSGDNGLSFVTDTVGLPRAPGCNDTVTGAVLAMFSLPNGKIVTEFGAAFYTKSPSDAAWVVDNSMRRYMAFTSSTWYRLNSSALFKSIDQGQNWTTTATTNFPPGMQPSVLAINSVTGRIYMNAKYGFDNISLFTDNEGTTWDTLHVNDFLGNSYLGFSQIVRGFIAKGDYIVFGADQNSNPSHPDVFVSTDGGLTFAPDTVGLSPNAGIENVIDLRYYNDELFMTFNSKEIYRKSGVVGLSKKGTIATVSVYPNPTQNVVSVKSDGAIDGVRIYDLQGKTISTSAWNTSNNTVDLSALENGIYLLKIQIGAEEIVQRIVKN